MTKKEKEVSRKRSEAAKKAAATRRTKAAQPSPDSESTAPESYKPKHLELQAAGLDQHSLESQRQAELAEAREEHNRRTGDASLA